MPRSKESNGVPSRRPDARKWRNYQGNAWKIRNKSAQTAAPTCGLWMDNTGISRLAGLVLRPADGLSAGGGGAGAFLAHVARFGL
jgi:hypothetical protein